MEERQFRLDDVMGVLRRRWRILVATAGSAVLLSILVAALLPNRYVASTTMLVEPQSVSKRLVEGGLEEADLMGRLHLLTMQILSRDRLSRVIQDLGLYPEESKQITREEVIEYMRSQIWVEPVLPELEVGRARRSDLTINTFRLFFRHEDGRTAADVANRLANDFIDEHLRDRVRASGDTAEFIEAELARLGTRTQEIEAQIARVKGENVGSLPEDMMPSQTRLGRTYEALRFAQQRFGEAESDMAFYQQQAKVARLVEGGRGDVIGRAVTPALRLRELEIQLGALRARGLTDKHPDIIIAEAEAAEIRTNMDSADGNSSVPSSIAEQEALAQVERARQRAEAARGEVARLQQEIETIETSLAATPRVAEQLDALQREWISLNESYQTYANKRLEASVAANMERRQKGEQFRKLEAAFVPPEPASPNRPLIVLAGGLFGLLLGGGLVFLREAVDTSYHSPRRLQEALRIPVLAAIPSILLETDRRARRQRQFREAFAAAAVAGTILLVSAVGYVYVNLPGLWRSEAETASTAPAPALPRPESSAPSGLPSPSPPPAAGSPASPTSG